MNQLVPIDRRSLLAPKPRGGELAKVAKEIRETDATIERVLDLNKALHGIDPWDAGGINRGKQLIEKARNWLASDDYADAKAALDNATAFADTAVIARELQLLTGAFPNTSKGDLALYGAQLTLDVSEAAPSRYAIAKACQDLRRTKNFLPSIAEILAELSSCEKHIQHIRGLLLRIPENIEASAKSLGYHEQVIAPNRQSPEPSPSF